MSNKPPNASKVWLSTFTHDSGETHSHIVRGRKLSQAHKAAAIELETVLRGRLWRQTCVRLDPETLEPLMLHPTRGYVRKEG